MTSLVNLVGESLKGQNGTTVQTSSINKKVVMLYFSAHWCPPCKMFTPKFAEFYKKHQDKIEVVFVSSDRDQGSYDEYFGSMPWLAIPYEDRARKDTLSKKFKVSGIPTVVFVDPETGEGYETNGRSIISEDPEAANFPWKPPSIEEALGDTFVRNDGTAVSMSDLKGKYIAIYFSAHWCPPCRAFTPEFAKTYKKLVEQGKNFEVIFASSDQSEDQFHEYMKEMPWLAIPFSDRKRKELLSNLFGVSGIPTLILLDVDFTVLNKAARMAISADPEGKEFPWAPKPVQTLIEGVGEINETPALIAMMEEENETVHAQFEAIFADIADTHKANVKKGAAEEALFLTSKIENEISTQIKKLCSLTPEQGVKTLCNGDFCMKLHNSTAIMILDIPDNGGFYLMQGELTKENITQFFNKYVSGQLKSERKQLNA